MQSSTKLRWKSTAPANSQYQSAKKKHTAAARPRTSAPIVSWLGVMDVLFAVPLTSREASGSTRQTVHHESRDLYVCSRTSSRRSEERRVGEERGSRGG